MTLKCPYCGLTNARPKDNNIASDTMFFPVGGDDIDLVFCVACMNVVSGPPVDGCLFLPSDERLAADLTAIQWTAKKIRDVAKGVAGKRHKAREHNGNGEGYNVRDDGAIEFCFKKTRNEKFVMNMVKGTLEKLGFANARPTGGTSHLCRMQCPSKKGYQHVMVKIAAVTVEVEDG